MMKSLNLRINKMDRYEIGVGSKPIIKCLRNLKSDGF